MRFRDAAKIYRAGLRVHDPALPSAAEWQEAVASDLPALISYAYDYGIPDRGIEGTWGGPFIPVMLPLEFVPTLVKELAKIAIQRDDNGRRRVVGEHIDKYLREHIRGTPYEAGWNFTPSFAVKELALLVLFRDYYRGRFGPQSKDLESAINDAGEAIGRELHATLLDPEPRAFNRRFGYLRKEVEMAHQVRLARSRNDR